MDLSRPLALVSGGPDSVALLRVLLQLGATPAVLHVNYGLRSEESEADEEFVKGLCEGLEVRCEVRRLDLPGRSNLQEIARRERYRLAEELADALQLQTIATGHTGDDVAETVLLNLARGSGLRGLGGIPPVRGRVVRPLIASRRRDVLDYLSRIGQPYRMDASNLTLKYSRNKVRHEVLPVLEAIHPGAAGNIARGAALVREDLEVLEGIAADAVEQRGAEVVVPLNKLHPLNTALQRYLVRWAYRVLNPEALGSALVKDLLELSQENQGTLTRHLPGGIVAAVRYGKELVLYRRYGTGEEEVELQLGELDYAGWHIHVQEAVRYEAADAARPEVAYLDAELGPYKVRLAVEGDEVRSLGLRGTKKVFRAMMDRKVPRDLRHRTPVVVDSHGRVAWIFGGEIGEEFKVDENTKKILRLEVKDVRSGI